MRTPDHRPAALKPALAASLPARISISAPSASRRCMKSAWFALLAVVVVCALPACSRSKEGDNLVNVRAEDAAMNAAIGKAKSTVSQFVAAFHAQKAGTKDYYVKKPYPTPSGGHEHMWIAVLEEKEGVIKGRVANEADETREVKNGQTVSFKVSEISDWKYQDGKKLVGGYTIRYFVEKMPPKERAAFLKEAGFEL
jgi:uncharacterized protein YegJ (DUF2314 family)